MHDLETQTKIAPGIYQVTVRSSRGICYLSMRSLSEFEALAKAAVWAGKAAAADGLVWHVLKARLIMPQALFVIREEAKEAKHGRS